MNWRLFAWTIVLSMIFGIVAAQAQGNRKTRVDFDAMEVRGQTKKADAVYVFERGSLSQKDLTKQRENYRKEILETMFR